MKSAICSFSPREPGGRWWLRGRSQVIAVIPLIPFFALLTGCGSGRGTGWGASVSPGTATAQSNAHGVARLTVLWPPRDASSGRLIPFAANSIQVQITSADGKSLLGSALLTRPSGGGASSATFERLPVGTALVTATAYPNADGSGVAQATAQTTVAVAQGVVTPVALTLASTIASLLVIPATQPLSPGGTVTLIATPKDAAGNVVLTSTSTLTWSTSSGTIATVSRTGTVTAIAAGTATITATETESRKSGTATISVGPLAATSISFAAPALYACPNAGGVLSGDFNNDGNVDLAVTSVPNIVIYEGKGDGTLLPPLTIFTGTDSPTQRAAGDFNNDGLLDLICSSNSNNNYVLLNNGNHTFKAITVPGTVPCFSAAITDFDGDGYKDAAVTYQASSGSGGIALLKNNGGTSFAYTVNYGFSRIAHSVAAGDLNGDGRVDLVGSFLTGFSVFLGNGNGTFTRGNTYTTATANVPIPHIADFNKDGLQDVTVNNYFDNNIGVLFGKGDGTFGTVAKYADAPFPNNCPPVDLDGDSYPDIVTANAGSSTMTYLRNQGDGTFAAGVKVATGISAVLACHAVDLNKDGRPESIVTGLDSLSVLLNTSK